MVNPGEDDARKILLKICPFYQNRKSYKLRGPPSLVSKQLYPARTTYIYQRTETKSKKELPTTSSAAWADRSSRARPWVRFRCLAPPTSSPATGRS